MSSYMGKNASIRIGTTIVARMTEWTSSLALEVVDEPVFGDDWNRIWGATTSKFSATITGLIDLNDTTGQNAIETACLTHASLKTLRFYVDPTNYWAPNTAVDADATAWITTYDQTASRGDIVRFNCTIEGSGEWHRTT